MPSTTVQALKSCQLFYKTDDALIARWLERFIVKNYPGDDVLYEMGTEQCYLYIILQGKVRLDYCAADGKEYLIYIVSEGQFFGEIELLEEIPSLARAVVMEPSHILMLAKKDFLQLYRDEHQVTVNLAKQLATNIRWLMNKANKSLLKNTEYRLAGLLLQFYYRFGKETSDGENSRYIQLHLTHDELAKMVGSTRTTMNKLLSAWKEKGWLDFHYGKIVIHQPELFEEYYRNLSQ